MSDFLMGSALILAGVLLMNTLFSAGVAWFEKRDNTVVKTWLLWVETPEHTELDFGQFRGTKNAAYDALHDRIIRYVVHTGHPLEGNYRVISL